MVTLLAGRQLQSLGAMREATQFLAVVVTVAAGLYYLPDYYLFEKLTADHSAWLLNAIGIKAFTWTEDHRAFLNEFEIARMCTGGQVIAVFAGILAALPRVALRKKLMALTVVGVSVYIANVFRIAFEIWMLYNGILPWELAHYPTGLLLGVIAVVFLVVASDYFIPEIGDYAFNIIDRVLKRRIATRADSFHNSHSTVR